MRDQIAAGWELPESCRLYYFMEYDRITSKSQRRSDRELPENRRISRMDEDEPE